jgi:hypothetical protein
MKMPNGDRAMVPIEKLTGYCLDPYHPRGRHKARVFLSVGVCNSDAKALRSALLAAARECDASSGTESPFGHRYVIDFDLIWKGRIIRVRSSWIIALGTDYPRLTSCYVL